MWRKNKLNSLFRFQRSNEGLEVKSMRLPCLSLSNKHSFTKIKQKGNDIINTIKVSYC